jgi:hypothetical protein
MIKVKEIRILFVEGAVSRSDAATRQRFTSFADADRYLRYLADQAPVGGPYDKTDVLITFEDGTEYRARVDLTREHATQPSILGLHVQRHCLYHSGRAAPPRFQSEPETWLQWLAQVCDEEAQAQYARILDRYALDDDC